MKSGNQPSCAAPTAIAVMASAMIATTNTQIFMTAAAIRERQLSFRTKLGTYCLTSDSESRETERDQFEY
jgi:hypothetical protein